MASKKLSVREDVYRKLLEAKKGDESFSDVIERLLKGKGDLMAFAGILSGDKEFGEIGDDMKLVREKPCQDIDCNRYPRFSFVSFERTILESNRIKYRSLTSPIVEMQTRQVSGLVIVIAILALALGTTLGYAVSPKITTTTTATQTQTITSIWFIPQGLWNVTELIIINPVVHETAYVCGTNTFVAGTVRVENTTTTEYIFPSTISGTSQNFPNVIVTTVTSIGVISTINDTTVTLTSTSQGTTVCPTII